MLPSHWIAIDGMVGAVVALAGMFTSMDHFGVGGPAPLARTLLAAAIFFPVMLRRRNPVAAFCALILLDILSVGAGQVTNLLISLAAAYVLYLTTVASSKRTGFAALALALIVIAVLLLARGELSPAEGGGGAYVPVAFAMIISWMTGHSVRQRRAYAAMLQDQAASSAVAEERLRIARELHDVVAHSMSVIAVQAGYGQYVIDSSPSNARDALGAIQATSRDALDEMRRMLGVLRQQDAVAGPEAAAARPGIAVGPRTPWKARELQGRFLGPGAVALRRLRRSWVSCLRIAHRSRLPRHSRPLQGSAIWTGSSSARPVRAFKSPCGDPDASGRCPPASTCRHTGSSRRLSPTWSSTQAPTPAAR